MPGLKDKALEFNNGSVPPDQGASYQEIEEGEDLDQTKTKGENPSTVGRASEEASFFEQFCEKIRRNIERVNGVNYTAIDVVKDAFSKLNETIVKQNLENSTDTIRAILKGTMEFLDLMKKNPNEHDMKKSSEMIDTVQKHFKEASQEYLKRLDVKPKNEEKKMDSETEPWGKKFGNFINSFFKDDGASQETKNIRRTRLAWGATVAAGVCALLFPPVGIALGSILVASAAGYMGYHAYKESQKAQEDMDKVYGLPREKEFSAKQPRENDVEPQRDLDDKNHEREEDNHDRGALQDTTNAIVEPQRRNNLNPVIIDNTQGTVLPTNEDNFDRSLETKQLKVLKETIKLLDMETMILQSMKENKRADKDSPDFVKRIQEDLSVGEIIDQIKDPKEQTKAVKWLGDLVNEGIRKNPTTYDEAFKNMNHLFEGKLNEGYREDKVGVMEVIKKNTTAIEGFNQMSNKQRLLYLQDAKNTEVRSKGLGRDM